MKNKLFTKLGIAALGLAMAVVTGAAIQNAATETKAAGESVTTITMTGNKICSGSSYIQSNTNFTVDGIGFTINNFNPSSGQVRGNQTTQSNMLSGKNFYLFNTTAFPGNITKISYSIKAGSVVATYTYAKVGATKFSSLGTSGATKPSNNSWTFSGDNAYFAIGMQKGGTSGTTTLNSISIYYEAGQEKVLTGVEYTGTLEKTSYLEGDVFDPTGLTFKAVYDDSSKETITDTSKITWSELKAGVGSVTGTYEGKTFTVTGITVATNELLGITISGELTKNTYDNTESWSTAGLKVIANYSVSGEQDVTSQVTWSFDPAKPTIGKEQVTITATFDDKTASQTYDVTVTEKVFKNTYGISGANYIYHEKSGDKYYLKANGTGSAPSAVTESTQATKIYFELVDDDTFVLYTDEVKENWLYCTSTNNGVRSGANTDKTWLISGPTSGKTGDYTFKHIATSRFLTLYNTQDFRCYTSETATNRTENTCLESAKDIVGLTIQAQDDATTRFLKGSTFDSVAAGYSAYIVYDDDSKLDVTDKVEWTLDTSVETTNATIKASYLGFEATVENIEIFDETISKITVDTTDAILEYAQYSTLNTDGLIIKGLTAADTFITTINAEDCTFSPTELNEAGEITITVTYNETISTTYIVTVTERNIAHKVTSIENLYDGQKVYLSNGSNKVAKAYQGEENNLKAADAIAEDNWLDTDTLTEEACAFTIGRKFKDGKTVYTFFDGTNYLYASSGKSNVLKGKTSLGDTSYFTIEVTDTGIATIVCADADVERNTIKFNSTNALFSCYANGQDNVYLYALTQYSAEDAANAFIENYMHLDYVSNEGLCAGENGYYAKAKEVFNALSDDEKLFVTENAEVYARLQAWASANGDVLNGDMVLETPLKSSILGFITNDSATNTTSIIIIITIIAAFGCVTIFLSRKRKHN